MKPRILASFKCTKDSATRKESVNEQAEEVLTEEPPKHDPPLLELDDELGESHAEDSPIDAEKGRPGQSEDKDDSAAVAEEALRRMSETSTKLPAKT